MKIEYVLSAKEVQAAKDRMNELRKLALFARDAQEMGKEFYLRAKGFEEALVILGIIQEDKK